MQTNKVKINKKVCIYNTIEEFSQEPLSDNEMLNKTNFYMVYICFCLLFDEDFNLFKLHITVSILSATFLPSGIAHKHLLSRLNIDLLGTLPFTQP